MKTLRWQILLPIAAVLVVAFVLLVSIVSKISNDQIKAATEAHLDEMAARHATEIELMLTDAMTASSLSASDYGALAQAGSLDVELARNLITNSITNSPPYYTAVWMVWHDQPDAALRFVRTSDGSTQDESFAEKAGNVELYMKAAAVTKSSVMDPIFNQNGVLTTHFVAPISSNGQIIGVIGYEVSLERATQALGTVDHYEGNFARLTDSQGIYIVHEDASKLSTKSNDADISTVSASKAALSRLEKHATLGRIYTVLEPVSIFNMDRVWTLQYSAPYSVAVAAVDSLRTVTIALFVGVFLLICISFILIINRISRPVTKLANVAQSLAQGNAHQDIAITSKTEIGQLQKGIQQVSTTFENLTMDMEHLSSSVQHGDLSVVVDANRYQGDYRRLAEEMNKMVTSIAHMVTGLRDVAGEVAISAEQISITGQGIAQGAAEQAATVDGIAASLGQVTVNTRNNAERASTANALTDQVRMQALESGQKMSQLVEAVEMIDEASQAVADIIKNINDIAMQTNLLSLNAAVEAARAGQAGKGFSVVADEVKTLATRTAKSAQETQALIANSIQRAKNGVNMAKDTQEALQAIVGSMDEVARTIEEITASTQEQAASIEMVDTSIDQVSSVIQQNTATAEESAAASVQMDEQATNMNKILSRYHLSGQEQLPTGNDPDHLLPPGRH